MNPKLDLHVTCDDYYQDKLSDPHGWVGEFLIVCITLSLLAVAPADAAEMIVAVQISCAPPADQRNLMSV